MASFTDVMAMVRNATFQDQVIAATMHTANYIVGEDPTTALHNYRIKFAWSVLANPTQVVPKLLAFCAQNGTLQVSAPTGPWLDTDIQYVVDLMIAQQIQWFAPLST